MEKRVSAADANRKFSELLRGVRQGRSYLITSHGRPLAKLSPSTDDSRNRAAAHAALLEHLKSQRPTKGAKAKRRWTRDELYDV